MHDLMNDLRYSVRVLARSPGFTAVALVTLALGIGANTAIFSMVNSILLRALPYDDADRLVELATLDMETGEIGTMSPGNFRDWAAASSLAAAAAYDVENANLTGYGPPRQLAGIETVGSLFDVLRATPLLGSTYGAAAGGQGEEPVLVLAHATWRELFGDDDPLGRTLTLDGEAHTVIGVMPPDFRFPDAAAGFWIPARYPDQLLGSRTEVFLEGIGRLAPGATLAGARSEVRTIAARGRQEHPQANEAVDVSLRPLKTALTADVAVLLKVLMGAVGLVLLIACVNLANLMLARASGREQEIAVRKALGASRGRLARMVVIEGLVVAIAGGALGLWLGLTALDALMILAPLDLPRAHEVRLDGGALAFTALIAIGAGLLFALLPALRVARQAPAARLGERGGAAGWQHRSLVVGEVVLAMVVLSVAGLMVRSFLTLRDVDPGYEPAGLTTMRVSLPGDLSLDRRLSFFRDLDARLEAVPGVSAASYTTSLPAVESGPAAWINLYDRSAPEGEPPTVEYRAVAPDFTEVAGVRLVAGRLPDAASSRDRAPEVLIDEVVASRFWPESDPLGRELSLGPAGGWIPPSRVVGVVAATQDERLGGGTPGMVYVPHALVPWWGSMAVVVRTGLEPASLSTVLRDQVAALDPTLPVTHLGPLDEMVTESIGTERSTALLLSLLGALGVLLAAVGLFGVLSYSVVRRTRELGIRVALGADPRRVRLMVLRQGVGLVALGVAGGAAAGLFVSGVLDRMLFEVSASDPVAFAAAGLVLVVTGVVASWVPARRATRVDPCDALRAQ